MRFWRGGDSRETLRGRRNSAQPLIEQTADATRASLPVAAVVELQSAAWLLERQAAGLTLACLAEHLDSVVLHGTERPMRHLAELAKVVSSCRGALERVSRAVDEVTRPIVGIPSELLYQNWLSLFPPERMAIVGGRRTGQGVVLGPAFDVTSDGPGTSRVHVRADQDRLRTALLGLERAGAHLAGWIHSHPGVGPSATQPSVLDRTQHADWVRDYSPHLVSMIVVADGVVRLWGTAIEQRQVRVEMVGSGVTLMPGDEHVYQLAR